MNKNGDDSKMVVVYPYYWHILTMAFYKLYTVYYMEKWATLKLIQDMEETLLSFAQNYTVFLIETVITRE